MQITYAFEDEYDEEEEITVRQSDDALNGHLKRKAQERSAKKKAQ